MLRWFYFLAHLLVEAGAARRDARIRFLKAQVEILRRKLGGNRVIPSLDDRARLLAIAECQLVFELLLLVARSPLVLCVQGLLKLPAVEEVTDPVPRASFVNGRHDSLLRRPSSSAVLTVTKAVSAGVSHA